MNVKNSTPTPWPENLAPPIAAFDPRMSYGGVPPFAACRLLSDENYQEAVRRSHWPEPDSRPWIYCSDRMPPSSDTVEVSIDYRRPEAPAAVYCAAYFAFSGEWMIGSILVKDFAEVYAWRERAAPAPLSPQKAGA